MNRKYALLLALLLVFSNLAAFAAGYFLRDLAPRSDQPFALLRQAHEILQTHAFYELPANPALEYGMIRGMLEAYGDPHTRFVEPVQTELNTNSLAGEYGGIGVELGRDAEGYVILHPFRESPAAASGVQDGDRLIQVDDLAVTPETPTEAVVAALRGPVGEPVSLSVARPPTFTRLDFTLKRAAIPLPSVTWHLAPDEPTLGIIKVNLIAASTAEEIQTAVAGLQARGARYFALDLRGNGGGLVDAGVRVARLFLTKGEVLKEQYRGQPVNTYKVNQRGPLSDIPLAVLVNSSTASAAEIVAGALQAQERAPLIGEPTFGKDSIQLAFDLQDGSSLHVTAAKWWIPGLGIDIGAHGLQPDIPTAPADENHPDPAVEAAIQFFTRLP